MGLDITFTQRKKTFCPHCGKEVATGVVVESLDSGGRAWYPFLEHIGYYVPYEQRTEENNWYGKDMVLTKEQINRAYRFAKESDAYNGRMIANMLAAALIEEDNIVVNADW